MLVRSITIAVFTLMIAAAAAAQAVYTPSKGSAERKAILNALRVPVERELATAATSSTGNSRSASTFSISRPTLPVAPTTATR